ETGAESNFMPLAEQIRPHVKGASLISLCSPLNPTGTTFSQEALKEICDMIVEENKSRKDDEKKLYLMYDQMYWHLTYGGVKHNHLNNLNTVLVKKSVYIDTISKVFASTGVRVSYALDLEEINCNKKTIHTHVGALTPMAEQKGTAAFLKEYDAIE